MYLFLFCFRSSETIFSLTNDARELMLLLNVKLKVPYTTKTSQNYKKTFCNKILRIHAKKPINHQMKTWISIDRSSNLFK